jgi:hypothetical protein
LNERPKNVFCLETPPTATISKIKEALALSEQFGPKYQQILVRFI